MTAPKKNREPDHLDAWGAFFSPRRPLIQWVCAMSDAQALALMRQLGLNPPQQADHCDDPMTLWDLISCANTQHGTDGITDAKEAPNVQAPLSTSVLADQVGRVAETPAPLGQLPAPLPGRDECVAQAQACSPLEDEPGLVLKRVTMKPSAGFETLDGLSTHTADQEVRHDAPAFDGQAPMIAER